MKKGYPQEAEDFAQWLMIKYLEGKSQYQLMRHSFSDYLTATQPTYKGKLIKREKFLPVHAGDDESEVPIRGLNKFIKAISTVDPIESKLDAKRLLRALRQKLNYREVLIFNLYYGRDFELKDIGRVLKLTEGRVSQIVTDIKWKFKKILGETDGTLL